MDKFFRSLLEIKWNIGKSRVSFLDALLLLAISGSGLVMRYCLLGGMSGCTLGWYWIFDYPAALAAAAIVYAACRSVTRSIGIYSVMVISPTILVLGSYWQKPDMCYICLLLLCVFGLILRKEIPAAICYALAVLIDPQALFFAPVLITLWLAHYIGNAAMGIGGVFSLIGAVLGGSFGHRLFGYGNPDAAETVLAGIRNGIESYVLSGGDRMAVSAGRLELAAEGTANMTLSDRWANVYQFLGTNDFINEYFIGGVLFTAALLIFILVCVILKTADVQDYLKDRMKHVDVIARRDGCSMAQLLIEAALFFAILVPYFMPHMNARSGLAADIFAVVLLFLNLKKGWIALVQLVISFSMYQTCLTGIQRFPLAAYSAAEGILLLYAGYMTACDLMRYFRTDLAIWTKEREEQQRKENEELRFDSKERIVIEEGSLRSALGTRIHVLKWDIPLAILLYLGAMLILGIVIRINFLSYVSQDYTGYWQLWFEEIRKGGGMKSLAGSWYDYSPLFMYFLVFIEGLPFDPMYTYKICMGVIDLFLAIACGLTAGELTGSANKGFLTTGLVYLIPTVMINSSLWCQCDVIYVTLLVLCLYEFMREKGTRAMIFYSLALCLKLQAAFVFPALVILWVYRKVRVEHIFLLPAFYIVSIIPAWIAGRPFKDLLLVYFAQGYTDTWALTLSWPNIYEIITPEALLSLYSTLGKCLIITILMCTMYYMAKKKYRMTKDVMLEMFLFYGMLTVYFLPFMHERYGYVADVLSVIYAVRNPKRFYVLILHILISHVSYTIFLTKGEAIPMIWYAFVLLGLIVIVGKDLFARMNMSDLEESNGSIAEQ